MLPKYFALILIVTAIAGCNTNTAATNTADKQNNTIITADTGKQAEIADSIRHSSLNKLTIVNQNDPVCDMPMIRGFDDTTTYNGRLIGFCSKECRDKFVATPIAYKIKNK